MILLSSLKSFKKAKSPKSDLAFWHNNLLWCVWRDSNPRPFESESNTLSSELQTQISTLTIIP